MAIFPGHIGCLPYLWSAKAVTAEVAFYCLILPRWLVPLQPCLAVLGHTACFGVWVLGLNRVLECLSAGQPPLELIQLLSAPHHFRRL